MASGNLLVERLVTTVARAFYTDDIVVVFDTLLREKFIRQEEIAPRLKMTERDVTSILTQLENEMMISSDVLNVDENTDKSAKYYYIDYQLFVHVVRYRIHLMTAEVKQAEKSELSDVNLQCPTCITIYSVLEAQKYRTQDRKFACPNCCPYDEIAICVSEPYFRLTEVAEGNRLTGIQILAKRMDEQLKTMTFGDLVKKNSIGGKDNGSSSSGNSNSSSNGNNSTSGSSSSSSGNSKGPVGLEIDPSRHHEILHEGIFELLHQLKDMPVSRNKPSINRLRGLGASKVEDEDVQRDIVSSIGLRRLQDEQKRQKTGHGAAGGISVTLGDRRPPSPSSMPTQSLHSVVKSFPEFLRDSRVVASVASSTFLNADVNPVSSASGSVAASATGSSTINAAVDNQESNAAAADDDDDDVNWQN